MSIRIFVLPTQYDIIDFRLGNRPENILVRHFASLAEAQAYERGIGSISDEYERIEDLRICDVQVSYSRRSEDPEIDAVIEAVELTCATPGEAVAFGKGLEDAEGYAAPLLVDDTDERFAQLIAWSAMA